MRCSSSRTVAEQWALVRLGRRRIGFASEPTAQGLRDLFLSLRVDFDNFAARLRPGWSCGAGLVVGGELAVTC